MTAGDPQAVAPFDPDSDGPPFHLLHQREDRVHGVALPLPMFSTSNGPRSASACSMARHMSET